MKRKYHNKPVEVDGIRFDSQREAVHYGMLKLREKAGEIQRLRCHPRYDIVVNGVKVGFMKPDFEYYDTKADRVRTEDVKGAKPTEAWALKAKIFKALYGREIEIVR